MAPSIDFFGTFPALHPGWLLFIYVVVPWLTVIAGVRVVSREASWKGGRIYSFLCNLTLFLYRFAPIVVVSMLFWSAIMLVNQASFAYRHLSLNTSPSYYLSVDLTSWDVLDAIQYVTVDNSYSAVTALQNVNSQRRRLQSQQVDTTLTLTYHTKGFDNLLSTSTVQTICNIERNIRRDNSSSSCIDSSNYHSIMKKLYNPSTCVPLATPLSSKFYLFGLTDNSQFVADNTEAIAFPSSPVIVSYFDLSPSCANMNGQDFSDYLNNFAVGTDIHITFSTESIDKEASYDMLDDCSHYLMISSIICIILLILFLHGFILPVLIMFSFFFALINAAAFIPLVNMKFFSFYNVGGYLILMCYGGAIMLLWNNAWRRQVKPATHPTIANIMNSYITVGQTILYITILGMITLFSLLASPVVIVRQFGAFTGFSILFFWLIFHYLLIPAWILTAWFVIPKKYHRRFRVLRSLFCPCYDMCLAFFKERKGWDSVALIAEFVPEDDEDEDFIDDEEGDEEAGQEGESGENDGENDGTTVDGRSAAGRTQSSRGRIVQAQEVQILDPVTARSVQLGNGNDMEEINFHNHDSVTEGKSARGDDDEDDEQVISLADGNSQVLGGSSIAGGRSTQRSVSGRQSYHSVAQPAATVEVISASPVPEDHNRSMISSPTRSDMQLLEMQHDTNFCRGKRPLKFFGLVALIMVLIGVLIVYIISIQRFHLNMGFPTESIVYNHHSNLAYQYEIVQYYKNDLFSSHNSYSIAVTTLAPTQSPSKAPLSLRPSMVPTRSPTLVPSSASAAPTKAPTTAQYVDYTVKGCWGVSYSKHAADDVVVGHYDYTKFQSYVRANNNGLVGDLLSVCQYVQNHRDTLNVNPTWNVNEDCIYNQYLTSLNSLSPSEKTVNNALLKWAKSSYSSGLMLGVLSNSTHNSAEPVWLCSNFSLRSYETSIEGNPSYFENIKDAWEKLFQTYSIYAKSQDIPVIVSSSAFTYPLLSHQQQIPLAISISCVVIGFVGLLWLFTLSDYGLTLFGSLSIFMIIIISICIHLYLDSEKLDIFDYMIFVSIILLLVIFPIQLIEEYMESRAFIDRQVTIQADKVLSPALSMTNKHFRGFILFPTVFLILISVSPMFSSLTMVRRISSYIIIFTLVSFLFTCLFQPYLLAFGCRTKHFEKLCYVEEDEEGGGSHHPGSQHRSIHRSGLHTSSNELPASPSGDRDGEEGYDEEGEEEGISRSESQSREHFSTISGSLPIAAPAGAGGSRNASSRRRGSRSAMSQGSASVNSRGGYSINSAASAGVMSLPGSVISANGSHPGVSYHHLPLGAGVPHPSMYHRPPPSYYPMPVDPMMMDGSGGWQNGPIPMTSPPPPAGMMYYPPPPGPPGSHLSSNGSVMSGGNSVRFSQPPLPPQPVPAPYDPRLMMPPQRSDSSYQAAQIAQAQQFYDPAYQQYMRQMAQQQIRNASLMNANPSVAAANASQYNTMMNSRPPSSYYGGPSSNNNSPNRPYPAPAPPIGPSGLHGQATSRGGLNASGNNSVSGGSVNLNEMSMNDDGSYQQQMMMNNSQMMNQSSMYISPPRTHSSYGHRGAAGAGENFSDNESATGPVGAPRPKKQVTTSNVVQVLNEGEDHAMEM